MGTEAGPGTGPGPTGARHTGDGPPAGAVEPGCRVPFGPYAGRSVEEVAVIDAPWLVELIAAGVGPADLRAAAARALLERDRFSRSVRRPTGLRHGGAPAALRAAVVARWREGGRSAATPRRTRLVAAAAGILTVAMIARGGGAVVVGPSFPGNRPAPAATPRPTTGSRPSTGGASHDPGAVLAVPPVGVAGPGAAPRADLASAVGPVALAGTAVVSATHGGLAAADTCGRRAPGAITADAAARAVGSFQAVEFRVAATKDTGRVTYLNSRVPYQGSFYVAVFPGDYDRFAAPPALLFDGRCIVVQGTIELYRGTPEIVLRSPDDVRILEEPPAS